jgi:hypothetical protein
MPAYSLLSLSRSAESGVGSSGADLEVWLKDGETTRDWRAPLRFPSMT